MVEQKTLMEQAMDVVYSQPELTLWEKIKNLFGQNFPERGYLKTEGEKKE